MFITSSVSPDQHLHCTSVPHFRLLLDTSRCICSGSNSLFLSPWVQPMLIPKLEVCVIQFCQISGYSYSVSSSVLKYAVLTLLFPVSHGLGSGPLSGMSNLLRLQYNTVIYTAYLQELHIEFLKIHRNNIITLR